MTDLNVLAEFRRLAHELETQDNAITSDPLFTVQQRRRQYGMDADYCEHFAWCDSEEAQSIDDDTTDAEERAKLDLLEEAHAGEIDWPEEQLGSEEMWTRTGYIDLWDFVQAFLTLEAAEQFRKHQAHNLGQTRIYVESGYHNPEWRLLRSLVERVASPLPIVERTEAPDSVTIEELTKYTFLAAAVLEAMGSDLQRFGIEPGSTKEVVLEMRINGVPVSMRSFLEYLDRQHTRMVREEAARMLEDRTTERARKIEDALTRIQEAVRSELGKMDLLEGEEW